MSGVVILNPRASRARTELLAVKAAVASSPFLEGADLRLTEDEGHARELAAEATRQGAELVVAAGGDGTINEVVNGLVDASGPRPAAGSPTGTAPGPVLAVLPLGTGNDLARSLGMPLDLEEALEAYRRGRIRVMDLLRLQQGERSVWCANHAAGGFTEKVEGDRIDELKESWGPLAYLRKALGSLRGLQAYRTELHLDEEVREDDVFSVVASNGRYAAGGIPVAPDAYLDDGLVDVVVVSAAALVDLGLVAAKVTAGSHAESEMVSVRRVRRLRVESEPGMWFTADGELVGQGPTTVEVVPDALRVWAGPRGDRAFAVDAREEGTTGTFSGR